MNWIPGYQSNARSSLICSPLQAFQVWCPHAAPCPRLRVRRGQATSVAAPIAPEGSLASSPLGAHVTECPLPRHKPVPASPQTAPLDAPSSHLEPSDHPPIDATVDDVAAAAARASAKDIFLTSNQTPVLAPHHINQPHQVEPSSSDAGHGTLDAADMNSQFASTNATHMGARRPSLGSRRPARAAAVRSIPDGTQADAPREVHPAAEAKPKERQSPQGSSAVSGDGPVGRGQAASRGSGGGGASAAGCRDRRRGATAGPAAEDTGSDSVSCSVDLDVVNDTSLDVALEPAATNAVDDRRRSGAATSTSGRGAAAEATTTFTTGAGGRAAHKPLQQQRRGAGRLFRVVADSSAAAATDWGRGGGRSTSTNTSSYTITSTSTSSIPGPGMDATSDPAFCAAASERPPRRTETPTQTVQDVQAPSALDDASGPGGRESGEVRRAGDLRRGLPRGSLRSRGTAPPGRQQSGRQEQQQQQRQQGELSGREQPRTQRQWTGEGTPRQWTGEGTPRRPNNPADGASNVGAEGTKKAGAGAAVAAAAVAAAAAAATSSASRQKDAGDSPGAAAEGTYRAEAVGAGCSSGSSAKEAADTEAAAATVATVARKHQQQHQQQQEQRKPASLARLRKYQPSLAAVPLADLQERLDCLADLLGVRWQQALALAAAVPNLLLREPSELEGNLGVLAALLGGGPAAVAAAEAPLLLVAPHERLAAGFAALQAGLRLPADRVREAVQVIPQYLMRPPEVLERNLDNLRQLLAMEYLADGGCIGCSGGDASGAVAIAAAAAGEPFQGAIAGVTRGPEEVQPEIASVDAAALGAAAAAPPPVRTAPLRLRALVWRARREGVPPQVAAGGANSPTAAAAAGGTAATNASAAQATNPVQWACERYVGEVVWRYPKLLTFAPSTLRAHYDGLVALLGPTRARLALAREPGLLLRHPRRLAAKLKLLRQLLDCQEFPHAVAAIVTRDPAVLKRSKSALSGCVRAISIWRIPPRFKVRMLFARPHLLMLPPEEVHGRCRWLRWLALSNAYYHSALRRLPPSLLGVVVASLPRSWARLQYLAESEQEGEMRLSELLECSSEVFEARFPRFRGWLQWREQTMGCNTPWRAGRPFRTQAPPELTARDTNPKPEPRGQVAVQRRQQQHGGKASTSRALQRRQPQGSSQQQQQPPFTPRSPTSSGSWDDEASMSVVVAEAVEVRSGGTTVTRPRRVVRQTQLQTGDPLLGPQQEVEPSPPSAVASGITAAITPSVTAVAIAHSGEAEVEVGVGLSMRKAAAAAGTEAGAEAEMDLGQDAVPVVGLRGRPPLTA